MHNSNEKAFGATHDHNDATGCKEVTSGPGMEVQTPISAVTPQGTSQDATPRRRLTKRKYHHSASSPTQTYPTTPPTAVHPALRPMSFFSIHSRSSSTSSTIGQAYDAMSVGSRPSTSRTIGREYVEMRPGILPNSDWTTGLTYEEMRGKCLAGADIEVGKKQRGGFLRGYKEELKQNFKAMDRAFSQY